MKKNIKTKIIFNSIMMSLMMLMTTVVQAQNRYTLTDADLEVNEDGVITSCKDFAIKDIIIPAMADGKQIIGIADGSFDDGIFQNKGITSVEFPSSLTFIGEWAFVNNSLTSLELPSSLSRIHAEAFAGNILTNVVFSEGLTTVGSGAFSENQLENLTFPRSLVNIHQEAFNQNPLVSVSFSEPSSLKNIGLNAFYNSDASFQPNIELPKTHNTEGFRNFLDSGGNPVEVITDFTNSYIAEFDPYELTSSDLDVDDNGVITACRYSFEITDIIIPAMADGKPITGIANGSFDNGIFQGIFQGKGITSIEFPSSLTFIGNDAFSNNFLTSLTFPEALISIGDGAFQNNQLTSVEFSTQSASLKVIGSFAFDNNSALTEIVLPTNHKTERFLYFQDSDGARVTSIEDFQKSYVARFTPYELTFSDLTVENGQITGCKYDFEITDIIIPSRVNGEAITRIANGDGSVGIFSNKGIVSVTFPEGLTYIGASAFQSNLIVSVVFPESLTSIAEQAFRDNRLTSVSFPSSLISIGAWAFVENSLSTVSFPTLSSLKTIGARAFSSNSLMQIELPDEHNIGVFDQFEDSDGNPVQIITDFEKSYYAKFSPYTLTESDLTVNDDGVITDCVYQFEVNSIIIPEKIGDVTITGIDDAFPSAETAEEILGIVSEGGVSGIFADKELVSVQFPSSLTSIGNAAFYNNELTSVSLPDGLTSIGDLAFSGNSLQELTLPENVTTIGIHAFSYNRLSSLEFPSSLNYIGENAFYNSELTNVLFSTTSSIKSIGKNAFSGTDNEGLSSITLPSDNSNAGFVGYLDSNAEKVATTDAGDYSITDFSLGYEVEIEGDETEEGEGTNEGNEGEGTEEEDETEEGEGSTVLSLSDDLNGSTMQSYPNPVQNMLTVERGADFRGDVNLRVFNALGKLVFSRSYSSVEKDMQVDFTTMPQGMYLLEVSDGAGSQTRTRIMKN